MVHSVDIHTAQWILPAWCFSTRASVATLLNVHACVSSCSWASYQVRKIAGCACAGNVFPRRRLQKKPLVSDPGMHHGTCVTHVPWCMSGSLTRGGGENVPGIPGACAPAILRIWQETHGGDSKQLLNIISDTEITRTRTAMMKRGKTGYW